MTDYILFNRLEMLVNLYKYLIAYRSKTWYSYRENRVYFNEFYAL